MQTLLRDVTIRRRAEKTELSRRRRAEPSGYTRPWIRTRCSVIVVVIIIIIIIVIIIITNTRRIGGP